jgi:RimJ/RimL family protein N-acetyltransferase
MENEYEIRRYEPSDLSGFLSLYEQVFGRIMSTDWFSWKYEENPYFCTIPIFIAETDGNLVGVRPFFSLPIQAECTTYTAFQPTDAMVHPDHRRRGLFTRMTKRALDWLADAMDSQTAFCFNFPNQQSLPGDLKLGWREVGTVPRYFRVQRPGVFLGDDSRLPDSVATVASRSYLLATRILRSRSSEVSVERYSEIPAELLASMYARRVPTGLHAHRTTEFYRWRFENPDWDYTTYVATQGTEPIGAIVVGVRESEGATLARITEVLPSVLDDPTSNAPGALLAAVVTDFTAVDMITTSGAAAAQLPLSAWGFLRDDRLPLSTMVEPRTLVARPIGARDWTIDDHRLTAASDWHLSFVEDDVS